MNCNRIKNALPVYLKQKLLKVSRSTGSSVDEVIFLCLKGETTHGRKTQRAAIPLLCPRGETTH